jgi:hypothetical protein
VRSDYMRGLPPPTLPSPRGGRDSCPDPSPAGGSL